MVITIMGILSASLTVFLKPAVEAYFDSRRRADLSDIADTAIRRITTDARKAVPNSIRVYNDSCLSFVPASGGGRYRMARDTSTASSKWLDFTALVDAFDVLSPLPVLPTAGDWVVISTQSGMDIYSGTNRHALSGSSSSSTGYSRITFSSSVQFPSSYESGRFFLVSNTEQVVVFNCVGGVLYRSTANFADTESTICSATSGAKLASDIEQCTFVYDPNQGATQQNGYVWMRIKLVRSSEPVVLVSGVHVDNGP